MDKRTVRLILFYGGAAVVGYLVGGPWWMSLLAGFTWAIMFMALEAIFTKPKTKIVVMSDTQIKAGDVIAIGDQEFTVLAAEGDVVTIDRPLDSSP
jgi:hypothetical protein